MSFPIPDFLFQIGLLANLYTLLIWEMALHTNSDYYPAQATGWRLMCDNMSFGWCLHLVSISGQKEFVFPAGLWEGGSIGCCDTLDRRFKVLSQKSLKLSASLCSQHFRREHLSVRFSFRCKTSGHTTGIHSWHQTQMIQLFGRELTQPLTTFHFWILLAIRGQLRTSMILITTAVMTLLWPTSDSQICPNADTCISWLL